MSMSDAIKSVFTHYADFSGRARRSEYWFFELFNVIVSLTFSVVTAAAMVAGERSGLSRLLSACASLYSLAVFVPTLAVTWRRLHDIGKSGAVIFLPLVPTLVMIVLAIAALASAGFSAAYASNALAGLSAGLLIALLACYVAMMVLYIILLVWLCRDGQVGPNKYGPDPKAAEHGYTEPADKAPWEY